MTAPIRVGLIRCDTHGLWYGPMMASHDPLVFQRPKPNVDDPNNVYSWQSGGIHMFFYAQYGLPTTMTVPFVGGFEIVRLWDVDRDAAEQAKAVFHGVPEVCDSPEQCSDDVDLVFISDCNLWLKKLLKQVEINYKNSPERKIKNVCTGSHRN